MFCLDPPLDIAPEGEWACPAHAKTLRNKKEVMGPPPANRDGGMRHRPPRIDHGNVKYQVPPA